jgi:PPP family 3-phenylpropionic acid transporter
VGLLLGCFEATGVIGPFLFGAFADRRGSYRGVILVTYLLTAAAVIPLAFSRHVFLSAVLIITLSLGYRSCTPMLDAMATIDLAKTRGDYGKIRCCGSAAFIVLALFLQNTPVLKLTTAPHIAIWGLIFACAAFFPILFLPKKYTLTEKKLKPQTKKINDDDKKIKFWTPTLVVGIALIMSVRFGMSPYYSFLAIFMSDKLHWAASGLIFANAATTEIPFLFISRPFIKRFGALTILALAALAVGIRITIYGLVPTKAGIIGATLLHSISFGMFHAAAVSFITDNVPEEKRAVGMSLYQALGSGLPAFLGAIIGGIVVQHFGYKTLFLSFTAFPAAGIVIFVLYRIFRREK